GGEKARLALARLLLRPANFLVMDEPTNHLDLAACEVLEEALRDYQGTLLFVSHDRAFVNAVATRVIEVRAGKLRDFTGNYDEYLNQANQSAASSPPGQGARLEHRPAPAKRARAASEVSSLNASEAHQDLLQLSKPIGRRPISRDQRRSEQKTQRALARAEQSILERESALEALQWRMADPAVHRDGERMRALDAERAALRSEVEVLYEEWEG